jgi:hypothetical protein
MHTEKIKYEITPINKQFEPFKEDYLFEVMFYPENRKPYLGNARKYELDFIDKLNSFYDKVPVEYHQDIKDMLESVEDWNMEQNSWNDIYKEDC